MKTFMLACAVCFSFPVLAQTWSVTGNIPETEYLLAVSFCDSLNGMVTTASAKVYATSDGGANWTVIYQDTVAPFSYLKDIKVYLPTYAIAAGANGTVIIYYGDGWIQYPTGTTEEIYSLYMATPFVGYAVGWGGLILKTVTGGCSWMSLPVFTSQILKCVHGYGTDHLRSVASEAWPKSDGLLHPWFGHIFTSDNGGNAWTQSTLPVYTFHSVFMVNETNAYIGGDYYTSQSSLTGYGCIIDPDGSRTYITPWSIGMDDVAITSIDMISPDEGFAAGLDAVCMRKNGHWYSWPNPKGANHWLADVDGLVDTVVIGNYSEQHITAWAVGNHGTVLKYREIITGVTPLNTGSSSPTFLYPNPSSGKFRVDLPQNFRTGSTITITDYTGRLLFVSHCSGTGEMGIDLSGFSDGLYLAHLASSHGDGTKPCVMKILKGKEL